MSAAVDRNELLNAIEWASAGETVCAEAEAYIDKRTGKIYFCGENVGADGEMQPPGDVTDEELFAAVPRKRDLDLGRDLALRFVDQHLPKLGDKAHECFRSRGAYARFNALLAQAGQLDQWRRYEEEATRQALREWCADNGFAVS